MEETNINITTENKELIIREGKAEPIIEKISMSIGGSISAVSEYINSKVALEDISVTECVVTYSKDDSAIRLVQGHKQKIQTEIVGSIQQSKKLTIWGINKETTYTYKELQKLVKQNRLSFADKSEFQKLMMVLKKFSVKVETIIEDENDNRGKEKKMIEKTAQTDLPEGFTLNLPLFKGESNISFNVELFYDVVGSGIAFYLESVDLIEAEEKAKDVIFQRELDLIEDFKCPKIEL